MVKELTKVDHVLRGESHITYRYRNSTGVRALLLSLLEGMGELEDQIELFQYFLNIYNARGATLDYWGDLYNVPGRPEDDTIYRSIIFSYMSMYRSQGDANSVRDALLAGFIASDCYVWDTDPGKYTAQVYNPTYPVDTQLLQRIVDTASAIGVGTTGITAIPGQYGYFGFAGGNQPTDAIPPFEHWETYNFNSGKYSPEGNGYRIFCSQGVYNAIKVSFACDDDEFYNELVGTANTTFVPYSFRFYAGTLGTVNNRIYAGGSNNKYLRFEMPIGDSTTIFENELKNTFGDGGGTSLGTLTITDRDGAVFKLTPVVQNSGVVTGQNRTSDDVTYRRISVFPVKNDNVYIQVEKDGVVIPSENITQFSSFLRTQENIYYTSNPNNILSSNTQTGLGEPVYFEDRNGHTWGIGAGASVTTAQLGNDEWELVDFELSSQLPALTSSITFYFDPTLGTNITVLGAYDDGDLGAGIMFTLPNNTGGQDTQTDLEAMQYLEYVSPEGKIVKIITPGSTVGNECDVVSTANTIVMKLKLFEGSGERVEGRICYGDISYPDGYENAKSLYLSKVESFIVFDQYNSLSYLYGMDDTVSLESSTVTRNNQPSHAFELQATMPIYDRDHEIDFETRNPWGLLKSYYDFTAISPTPIVKGTWGYTQYHADSDSSFKFLSQSDTNWGDRIGFSYVSSSQTRSMTFRVEDNEKGREFYNELVNNFKTNNGSISFKNTNGDVGLFTSLDKDATELTLQENPSNEWSVATLLLRLTFTTGGVDSIELEVDGSTIPVADWNTFQWESYQEFSWASVNPDGIQLGIATVVGQGPSYFTGEDVGHYSEKMGLPNYLGNPTSNAKSTDWGDPDETTIASGYQTMGYTVTDGRAENPDRLVENAWKHNAQEWIDYSREYSDEQSADVDAVEARLDNLNASEVIHRVGDSNLLGTSPQVDFIGTAIADPDFRTDAPTSLSFLKYDLDQVLSEQTQQSNDVDDYNNTAIEQMPTYDAQDASRVAILLPSTLMRLQKDLTKYDAATGGRVETLESRDDYIVQPYFQGIPVYADGGGGIVTNIPNDNEIRVYKRELMSTDVTDGPETYHHATMNANDYWIYYNGDASRLPIRGLSGWVQRGSKIYFTVSWLEWSAAYFGSYWDTIPFDPTVDLYEWDLDTDTQTLLHSWTAIGIETDGDDNFTNWIATGTVPQQVFTGEIAGCVYYTYCAQSVISSTVVDQFICMYNLEHGTSTVEILQRVYTDDGQAVGDWPNYNYWYHTYVWPLIGLPEPTLLVAASTDCYEVNDCILGLRKITISPGGAGVNPSVLSMSDWKFQDITSTSYNPYPTSIESEPPRFTGDIEYDAIWGRFFLTIGYPYDADDTHVNLTTWIGGDHSTPFMLQGKFDFSQIFTYKIGAGPSGLDFGCSVTPQNEDSGFQLTGANGIIFVPKERVYYISLNTTAVGSVGDSTTAMVAIDQNGAVLKKYTNFDLGWDYANVTGAASTSVPIFSPQINQQAGLITVNNAGMASYNSQSGDNHFTQIFTSAFTHRQLRMTLPVSVDVTAALAATEVATLYQTITSSPWFVGDQSSMRLSYERNTDGKVYLQGTDNPTFTFEQGDTLEMTLEGWWDSTGYNSNGMLTVYTDGLGPKVSFFADLSAIDGQTVEDVLDLLLAQVSVGNDSSYVFLGGQKELPAFDNHVTTLSGGDPSYLEENATLVANVPYTVNHTLGEKLVVVDVYTYPGGVTHNCEVRLVNNNSLTLTSSTNATVSIFVKA